MAEARIRVVAAVIERDGRLLVCQRPAHKRHGGLWEFPGGKVHDGESDFAAVRRELEEELGLDTTSVGRELCSIADPGSEYLIVFVATDASGEPVLREHAALAWTFPSDLAQLPLAPSDAVFARTFHNDGVDE
jgi:mutator protein MutT